MIDRFELAINEQNVTQISDLCDAFVEIETVNTDRVTSRAQLGAVLKEFFSTYPLKSFTYVHKGSVSIDPLKAHRIA